MGYAGPGFGSRQRKEIFFLLQSVRNSSEFRLASYSIGTGDSTMPWVKPGRGLVLGRETGFFSPPKRPEPLRVPPNLLFNRYRRLYPRDKR